MFLLVIRKKDRSNKYAIFFQRQQNHVMWSYNIIATTYFSVLFQKKIKNKYFSVCCQNYFWYYVVLDLKASSDLDQNGSNLRKIMICYMIDILLLQPKLLKKGRGDNEVKFIGFSQFHISSSGSLPFAYFNFFSTCTCCKLDSFFWNCMLCHAIKEKRKKCAFYLVYGGVQYG